MLNRVYIEHQLDRAQDRNTVNYHYWSGVDLFHCPYNIRISFKYKDHDNTFNPISVIDMYLEKITAWREKTLFEFMAMK